MIVLKSHDEILVMQSANKIVVDVMRKLKEMIRPGMNTLEMDRTAEELIRSSGAEPAFKGYRGYQHTLCTSLNEQVVHGIPGERVILREGDIISVDCGVLYKGFYGDHAWTFGVGEIDKGSKELLSVTEEALKIGINEARAGNRLYDISAAIQDHVEKNSMSVVREYVGHGIGRNLHEDPQVPNFGEKDTGIRLRAGMTIAIEPMVNLGTWKVKVLDDEWTVVTADGERSAHFEHSIAITDGEPIILSATK